MAALGMVVTVFAAVAEILHERGRRVADVQRHGLRRIVARRLLRRAPRRVHLVRFRRRREVDDRLRDRELAFRRAQEVVRVLRRERDRQRARIGEPDVLHRHPHDAARDIEHVLAALDHAREPVERAFDVAAAHGLVERGDHVVVLLAGLVVLRDAPLEHRRDVGRGHGFRLRATTRTRDVSVKRLGRVQRAASVAVGVPHEQIERVVCERRRLRAVRR